MTPTTYAIIQARMSSSRLPGKVLHDIAGKTMLERVVERTARAARLSGVLVATTTDPTDDALADFCAQRGIECTRGSLHDVLARYYHAAQVCRAEVVVRVTADCPLIDPGLIDEAVAALLGQLDRPNSRASRPAPGLSGYPYDFVANRLPSPWGRTYPIGLDVEVCPFAALEMAYQQADQPHQREHVMPFLYEDAVEKPGLPSRFRILLLNHVQDYGQLRWTVDTPADLELARQIFARFSGRDHFSWLETLALFEREPELAQINAQVQHKSYRQVDERLTSGSDH